MTILGCRSGMPADEQPSSGYLVASDTATILLDCGPGIATALGAVAAPDELSAVLISHLHLDHCYDLLPVGKSLLTRALRYPGAGDAPQRWADLDAVPLYVPAGAAAVLRRLAALFPVTTAPVLDRAFDLAFDVREYQPGTRLTVGDMTVTLHELRHSAPNCGIRIESPDGCLAYTGDTGVTPGLLPLAAGADLLLAEATRTATDHGPHGHLSAVDAARAARDAGARSLVLTHFPSAAPDWLLARRDEAAREFAGPIHLARPGATFEIGQGHGSTSSKTHAGPRGIVMGMGNAPVNLSQALAAFSEVYSPRIAARVNDYDVKIAHFQGDHLWHVHEHSDEFFLVLDGQVDIWLREDGRERVVTLGTGDVFVVPKGTEHKPGSPGASVMMFEPSGTVSTGDRHEGEIPDYVDSTTGHVIAQPGTPA